MVFRFFKKRRMDLDELPKKATEQKKNGDIDPGELQKKATEQKKNGDIDGAIISLRSAYKQLEKQGIKWPINTYLRLPLFLQKAGRTDEAWAEFNALLRAPESDFMLSMNHSIIHDKMRLFLQREGKASLAVKFGVLSYVETAIAYDKQGRPEELKQLQDEEIIHSCVKSLLKKANKPECEYEIAKIIIKHMKSIKKINLSELAQSVDAIVSREKA
ncbi:MAG: hypothetical protein HGJ94_18240 [Desulfosarcina sp.]|nr:hypothetical protein [Desulfosarcina sp.]